VTAHPFEVGAVARQRYETLAQQIEDPDSRKAFLAFRESSQKPR